MRSYLAVPVFGTEQELVGSLMLGHSQPDQFTQQAEELVVGIAAQAGVAVQKARLYTQVKEREECFRQLIEEAADGILVGNRAGICQEVNTALCHLLGYTREELLGRPLTDLVAPADAAHLAAVQEGLQLKQVDVAEWTFLRQDGTSLLVEISIKALSQETWQAIVRDISERKRIEERERQQDRLAVVGQLAAGIAHDFNNSLAIILLQAQLTLHATTLSEKDQQRLQTIYAQTKHAAQLTTQILDFSRQSVLEHQEIDLCAFLTEVVGLLRRTLSEQIHISFTHRSQAALARIDVTRLQQVMINLAVNARDAMPQGGTLHIELFVPRATAQHPLPFSKSSADQWFCIQVTDSGAGIAPDVLPHIFEPFFSTKAQGEGTGLGLAQVHGIIQQHGGFIDVASRFGEGTSFLIYLPAALSAEVVESPTEGTAVQSGQHETILVVEDDAGTRAVVADMLDALNYQVLTAADGKEALRLFTQNRNNINLILSDLVMPHMDGRKLLQQLKQQQQAVKLIMMSGYPQADAGAVSNGQEIAAWLPKPFTLEQIAVTIRNTLAV